MRRSLFAGFFLYFLVSSSFLTQSACAATVSLLPSIQSANVGDTVTVDLFIDFTDDSTVGGGVDLFYDSTLLSFVSFSFDSGLSLDASFSRQPDDFNSRMPAELNGLGFGNFAGLSGPGVVGTFTFNALAVGTAYLEIAVNDFEKPEDPGAFFSASTFNLQNPSLQGANVVISAVPLPAAAWLFLSGIFALCTVKLPRESG